MSCTDEVFGKDTVRSVIIPATWRDCAMAIGLLRLPSRSGRPFTRPLPAPGRRG